MNPPAETKRTPTISGGRINYLSVSQLQKHARCPRAWYFAKVVRLPEPTTASQEVGIQGHAQLEHYLKTGENVLGPIAAAGLPYLPQPGEGLLVEAQFGVDIDVSPPRPVSPWTVAGIPMTGKLDLVNLRGLDAEIVTLSDHKFTSDVEKWSAAPEDLVTTRTEKGIQMVGYAVAAANLWPDVKTINLEHLYYQTRGRREALPVRATITPRHARAEWQRMEVQAEAMKQHACAPRSADVPKNEGAACRAFGGCPFLEVCPQGERTMSLLNRLKNPTVTPDGRPIAQAPAPAPQAAAPSAPPPQAPIVAPAPAQAAPVPSPSLCSPCGETLTPENSSRKASDGSLVHIGCPTAKADVLPPDAPAPVAVPEVKADTAPEQKKRGRPAKAKTEETAPASDGLSAAIESLEASRRAAALAAPKLALYVDCVPTRGASANSLDNYVAELAADVSRAAGFDGDLRFADGGPLGFGKWKGALAMAARAAPPAPGAYVALGTSQSELLAVVVEALTQVADLVVRGAR